MAKRRVEIDIVANDNSSSVFQNIRSNASGMASSLMNTLNGAATGLGELHRGLRSYNTSMYRFNRTVNTVIREAGEDIYNFTKDAIDNFSALEQQHAKTMGAMATEYDKTASAQAKFLEDSKRLKQQAIDLGTNGPTGKGSLYTPDEVAYAQTALVKSGMSADNILNSGALSAILKFAGGNDLDIDTATQFAVNLGTVFNKPVEEWGTMLDQITKAADISVIDVEDIMDSLTYTGGIASGLDRDLEEVLGIIAVMGQAGLRGRVAGTGLQAFFTRILSAGELSDTAIGNAPTEYVGQMYNAFIAEAVNDDGSFKDMDEVASLLDDAMNELDDQEQAWFAKKLFGLYQMKAAYALTGSVDGDENLITDFIDQIENQSEGSNDAKLDLMLESQYGKLERTKNKWEGVKTDFGSRLSPIVTTVADELFNFLDDPSNYEINWDTLRSSISTSGELIGEKYGEKLREVIEDIGNFGIDAAQITEALTPQADGFVSGILKLLSGDLSGALDDFSKGIEDTNKNIDGLPDDLKDVASAASKAFTALTALAGVNLATSILEPITSALYNLFGRPIKAVTARLTSTNTTVSSTSSTVNATSVQVNSSTATVQAGTATTVNIGEVPLMNVTATVVNVYGGSGSNPTNPGSGGTPLLPSSGTPLLPSGGGGFLPGLAAGVAGTAGTAAIGSGSQLLLNGSAGALGSGTGEVIEMVYNPLTKSYVAKSELIGMAKGAGITALKSIPFWASLAYLSLAPSADSQTSTAWQYGFGTDYSEYLGDNYKNIDSIAGFFHDTFGPAGGHWNDDISNYKMKEFKENEVDPATPDDYREARDELFDSIDGFKDYTIGRQYISGLLDRWYYDNSNGDKNFISKEQYVLLAGALVDAMGQYMSDNNITDFDSGMANGVPGINTDTYTSVLDNMLANNDPTKYDFFAMEQDRTQGNLVPKNTQDIIDGAVDIFSTVNTAIDKIQQPVVNVNVITNVDKSGNATSDVTTNIDFFAMEASRRSSQYGRTNMIN